MFDKLAIKTEILKLQAVLNKMIEEDDFSNYDQLYKVSKQLDTLIVQFMNKPSSRIRKTIKKRQV